MSIYSHNIPEYSDSKHYCKYTQVSNEKYCKQQVKLLVKTSHAQPRGMTQQEKVKKNVT